MKIIFLNTWFLFKKEELLDYLQNELTDTNTFCFQEVSPENYKELEKLFLSFKGIFIHGDWLDGFGIYGQAIFVKKDIVVEGFGKEEIYEQKVDDQGFLQWLEIKKDEKKLLIGNYHGMARPGDKLDNPNRILQSERLINFLGDKKVPIVLGGDFNLLPQTKSVSLFEEADYRNLVKEYNVDTTRNEFTWARLKPGEVKQYFADYVFCSKDIKVIDFQVPKVLVSDHLPLIISFEI